MNLYYESKQSKKSWKVARICFFMLPFLSMVLCICAKEVHYNSTFQKALSDNTVSYVVKKDDTLWNIATKENDYGISTRDMVYIIQTRNELSDTIIREGEILQIPCKEEEQKC